MTFGSLFSGIGGIDLGLERAGMECRWQVEIDPFCNKVLAQHWPQVRRYGDIRTVTGNELEPVDCIAGGFPCQDLSQAGKRIGIEGTRSGLWFEFARLVGELRPRYVLIENVPGLLVPGAMSRVVGELARLGYVGCWRCLRAADFGASHIRKRVVIVAYNSRDFGWGKQIGVRESAIPGGISAAVPELAYRPSGGLGELPSGSHGLADRRNEAMADTERSERRPDLKYEQLSGGRIETADRLWSDGCELADSQRTRCDGSQGQRLRTDGPSLLAPRSSVDDGHLEDARCAGNRRPAQPAGFDRRRASGDDSGTSGTLADPPRDEQPGLPGESGGMRRRGVCESGEQLADPESQTGMRQPDAPEREENRRTAANGTSASVLPDSSQPGLPDPEQQAIQRTGRRFEGRTTPELGAFAPGPADPRWPAILRDFPDLAPALEVSHGLQRKQPKGSGPGCGSTGRAGACGELAGSSSDVRTDEGNETPAESPLRGMAHGLPDWMERAMRDRTKRLGRLGNAVVPEVAEWIGKRLLSWNA